MSHDDLDHIPLLSRPAIVPPSVPPVGAAKERAVREPAGQKPACRPAWHGLLARLLYLVIGCRRRRLCLGLAVAAATAAGRRESWQTMRRGLATWRQRLSDTDRGHEPERGCAGGQDRRVGAEVRKLWDNVWKQSKERLANWRQPAPVRVRRSRAWRVRWPLHSHSSRVLR